MTLLVVTLVAVAVFAAGYCTGVYVTHDVLREDRRYDRFRYPPPWGGQMDAPRPPPIYVEDGPAVPPDPPGMVTILGPRRRRPFDWEVE